MLMLFLNWPMTDAPLTGGHEHFSVRGAGNVASASFFESSVGGKHNGEGQRKEKHRGEK